MKTLTGRASAARATLMPLVSRKARKSSGLGVRGFMGCSSLLCAGSLFSLMTQRRIRNSTLCTAIATNSNLFPFLLRQHLNHLIDGPAFPSQVQHRMAIWADRPQILDRIYMVLRAHLGQR